MSACNYSGPKSKEFWDRIAALPEADKNYLYELGCALQELEARTHRLLESAEHAQKKRPCTCGQDKARGYTSVFGDIRGRFEYRACCKSYYPLHPWVRPAPEDERRP